MRFDRLLHALALVFGLCTVQSASAQCPPAWPYVLQNGQVADAAQVMANFDFAVSCIAGRGAVGSGTAGQVAVYGSSGTTVVGQALTTVLDTLFGTAQGSIIYRAAAGWSALTPGTAGQVLQSGGPSGNPSWGTNGGGGVGTLVASGVAASSATVAITGAVPISRPNLAAFAWVNQGAASAIDHASGPLVLRTVQNTASASSLNILTRPVAGANWTVTVQFSVANHYAVATDLAGLTIYNSVNGRAYVMGPYNSTTISVFAYASPTSYNATSATKGALTNMASTWLRAQYTAATTTLVLSYSFDGFTWETVLSTSSPYIGVPTGYGVNVGTSNNTAGHILSLNYMVDSSP